MICPHCHHKIPQDCDRCPHCGRPVAQHPIEDEPKLSHGMKVFIVVGTTLLGFWGAFYLFNHLSDPEYTRTPSYLEPDSTLIEKQEEYANAAPVDKTTTESIEEKEKEEAKKVYNSIRRPHHSEVKEAEKEDEDGSNEEETGSSNDDPTSSSSSTPNSSAPSPRVEAIGGE